MNPEDYWQTQQFGLIPTSAQLTPAHSGYWMSPSTWDVNYINAVTRSYGSVTGVIFDETKPNKKLLLLKRR